MDVFPSWNDADRHRDKSLQQSPSLKKTFKRIASYLKRQGLKNISEYTTTVSDVSRTSIQLTSLPAELLLMIISHLDIVNQVCLQCDMDKYPTKIACAFCKTVRPTKMFRSLRHELGLWDCLRHPGVFQSFPGMMKMVPVSRLCCQDRKDYFTRHDTLRTSDGTPVRISKDHTPRWLLCRVHRCWHCASLIRFGDKRKAGCLNCLCDFCPRFSEDHYFRSSFCRPDQGLYKWDGRCNAKICKKTVRTFCVREVGGRIVPVGVLSGKEVYYV